MISLAGCAVIFSETGPTNRRTMRPIESADKSNSTELWAAGDFAPAAIAVDEWFPKIMLEYSRNRMVERDITGTRRKQKRCYSQILLVRRGIILTE